jgi:phosphate-selective porin OprO/OprP
MRTKTLLALSLLGLAPHAFAATDDWPTRAHFDDGIELGVKGNFQYDTNQFSTDHFDDATTWRRQVVTLYGAKKGVFNADVGYDFQSNAWQDVFLGATTGIGHFRLGEFKTPVGMEDGATSASATTFLETSLAGQAVYEGRRLGLEWKYTGLSRWAFQLAYFGRHDLNDAASGNTAAARAVFNPDNDRSSVFHLGLSAPRQARDDRRARARARPEVNLTTIRLVDTGTLTGVDRIERAGLEAAWLHGPWLAQAEYLTLDAHRNIGSNYRSDGYYVSGSWLLTGESRRYRNNAFGAPTPARDWGALEFALRYSAVDLDDGVVRGGEQHDWTLGVNWYLPRGFKLQANYIRAWSDRRGASVDPEIFALRAQLAF